MRPQLLFLGILTVLATANGRLLLQNTDAVADGLPPSIICNVSLLLSAGVVDPAYACSPAYYNCLGVEAGQPGPLSYCQDGLVFDNVGDAHHLRNRHRAQPLPAPP